MEISEKVNKLIEGESEDHDDSSEKISEAFICCICLDLLYKPVVLACGHISCFWCVHMSMSGLHESNCPICRHPYHHFPKDEKVNDCFSPQFSGPVFMSRTEQKLNHLDSSQGSGISSLDLSKNPSCSSNSNVLFNAEQIESGLIDPKKFKTPMEDIEATNTIVDHDDELHQGIANRTCQTISVDDMLCTLCNQLIYRPVVLNCGHAYCESCVVIQTNETVKCQKCQSSHPGQAPKVCLEFDNFLKEQFPGDYALRRSAIELKQSCSQQESQSTCSSEASIENSQLLTSSEERNPLSWLSDHKVHFGAGCDSCGLCPIIGDRYRCKDCVESVGYDLCGDCYNTCLKIPGRFNQKHTPEHRFEIMTPDSTHDIMLVEVSDASNASNDVSENPGVVLYLSDDVQETAESGFVTPNETEEDQSNHQ